MDRQGAHRPGCLGALHVPRVMEVGPGERAQGHPRPHRQRDQILEIIVKTDPHSPDVYRINGVFPNMPDFYRTYDVQAGDGLFLPEDQRVKIW